MSTRWPCECVRVVRVVREAEPGNSKQTIDDNPAPREWRSMLDELNESGWDAEFLHEEWTQVILGQAVASRTDYFPAGAPAAAGT